MTNVVFGILMVLGFLLTLAGTAASGDLGRRPYTSVFKADGGRNRLLIGGVAVMAVGALGLLLL